MFQKSSHRSAFACPYLEHGVHNISFGFQYLVITECWKNRKAPLSDGFTFFFALRGALPPLLALSRKKDTCLKIFVCTCTLLGVTFGEDGAACWTAVDSVEVTSSTRKKIVEVSWNIFKHWTNRSVALSSCGSRSHHASVKIGCHASQSLEHFSHDEPSILIALLIFFPCRLTTFSHQIKKWKTSTGWQRLMVRRNHAHCI